MTIPQNWIINGDTYYAPIDWGYNQPVINDGEKNIVTSLGAAVTFSTVNLRICSFEYSSSFNVSKDQPYVESGKALYAVLKEDVSTSTVLETNFYKTGSSEIFLPNQTEITLVNMVPNVFENYGEGLYFSPHSNGNHRIFLGWLWSSSKAEAHGHFKLTRSIDGGSPEEIRLLKYKQSEITGSGEVSNVISGGSITGSTKSGNDEKLSQLLMVETELLKDNTYEFLFSFCPDIDSKLTVYSYNISVEYKPLRD